MNKLLRSLSYIFHPLFMPLLGVAFYYYITPHFVVPEIVQAKLVSLLILTLILPMLMFFLLNTLGKVKTIHLATTKERIYPLALNCIIMLLVIKRIITPTSAIALYYFFVGILISNMACLILALFKFKASIHMIGISGLFMFFVALGVMFAINLTGLLAFMALAIGAVATSRLHLSAHSNKELIVGFFVGLIPQLILVNYWF